MLYTERNKLAMQLLADAVYEGVQIMVVGSGVWFDALERALQRVHRDHFVGHAIGQNHLPLLNESYQSGGCVQFVNLSTGDNLGLLNVGENPQPQVVYLVEDTNGVHAVMWRERVRPYLRGSPCRVVYLGDTDDQPI